MLGESMEWLCRSKQSCFRLTAHILFAVCPFQSVVAFEILSEGAMDSVSAVASGSAENLLNVAGAPAAGLVVDGYDALPYQLSEGANGSSASGESLDSVLLNQIEDWADDRRESSGSGFEVGFVEQLPQAGGSILDEGGLESEPPDDVVELNELEGEDEEEERRLARTIERDELGELIPEDRFFDTSFEERVSINNDLSDYDRNPGAGFVFDRSSENANRLTSLREENKPLF
ncbi:hypothetical protein A3742_09365 [Oleiphilus sp. HI0071]|nr:hypothetical protein A3737_07450 [Oleiphilus sp. HI0065]KZY82550.1 hypothetical protein A3742_09365 [Oleiphilus sp. HI0071]KZY92889.1 hypothetical protein A3744_14560 [Oleiphilus sp. HI0073]KZZ15041.1 hypothetical protein A3750_01350 [Oleiphilus sp. HI0079]KZZ18925.1 hypothetical protein A3751_06620 [Oleiphilus sp. HI0080]KZZ44744.1 hypothetical protein A3758_01965 [Oleiphilus sp. HI0118]KZZ50705.1 hypothetical protein A3760_13880 [Oleiphilus sp. HI0122]KZZ74391.1 hypothetical protein A37